MIIPVSYTHLDVYKRQTQGLVKAAEAEGGAKRAFQEFPAKKVNTVKFVQQQMHDKPQGDEGAAEPRMHD